MSGILQTTDTLGLVSGLERIAAAFARARAQSRLAVAVYLTVGFPERDSTRELIDAAEDGGADLIELGVPFSDPLADGATVQRASEIALRNGITLRDCLDLPGPRVAEAVRITASARPSDAAEPRQRGGHDVPRLLMGYTNPFQRYGYAALARDAAARGICGVIVPDMPAEESAPFAEELARQGLARIDLIAPTTPDARLERLLPASRGFVYCVALTGVTGARAEMGGDVADLVGRVRQRTALPIAVGFGISRPEHVARLRGLADGVVIGSAALDAVAGARPGQRAAALRDFVRSMRDAGQVQR